MTSFVSEDTDEAEPASFDPAMVVVGLGLALTAARSREHARAALADAWECVRDALDEADSARSDTLVRALLRDAVERVLREPSLQQSCSWIAMDELRSALAALEDGLDADARALASSEDQSDDISLKISSWIENTHREQARLDRTITVLWDALVAPRARKAAQLIDVAERCTNRVRARVLFALASRGVDVRGPLASDPALDDESRVAALSRFGEHRERVAIEWTEPSSLVMARACADWTRFASHPRALFFHYAKHVGAAAWPSALEAMQRWPLAVEVRSEWQRQRERTPSRIVARPLSKGAWACGRCDSHRVRALRRWSDEDESTGSATTGEVEYQCSACGLRYWASWDDESLTPREPEPEAWVVS